MLNPNPYASPQSPPGANPEAIGYVWRDGDGLTAEESNLHREFNYKIHTAIDLLKLGIVLERMVEAGRLSPEMASTFEHQASGLLAAVTNENHRAFGKTMRRPVR